MKFRYESETPFSQPTLLCTVSTWPPGRVRERVAIPAVVDTGADLTLFPDSLRRNWNIESVGIEEIMLPDLKEIETELFSMVVQLPGWKPVAILAGVHPGANVLMGQDILQHGTLIANGVRQEFELIWGDGSLAGRLGRLLRSSQR